MISEMEFYKKCLNYYKADDMVITSAQFVTKFGSMFQLGYDRILTTSVNPIEILQEFKNKDKFDLKEPFISLRDEIVERIEKRYAKEIIIVDTFTIKLNSGVSVAEYHFKNQREFIKLIVDVCVYRLQQTHIKGYLTECTYILDIEYSLDSIIDLVMFLRYYDKINYRDLENIYFLKPLIYTRIEQPNSYIPDWTGVSEHEIIFNLCY